MHNLEYFANLGKKIADMGADGIVIKDMAGLIPPSETAALVDKAVKRLVTESYEEAKQILTDNRSLLDEIAEHLLLKETITGDELMAFVKAAKEPKPEETPAEEPVENAE